MPTDLFQLRIIGIVLAITVTACGAGETTPPVGDSRLGPATTSRAGETTLTADTASTIAVDITMQDAVDAAVLELAASLGLGSSEIEVIAAERVTWPDGSLGCPEPGVAYTQALVDGYRILLQAGSTGYSYHGAAGEPPKICPRPVIPPPID